MSNPWAYDKIPEGGNPAGEGRAEAEPSSDDVTDSSNLPFPQELLPVTAREMVREIIRVTTSGNEPLAAMSVIGIASASLGGGIQVLSGGERITKGNLFILGIAKSGTGKGETFSIAAAPFYEAQASALADFNKATRPGLEAELQIAEKYSKSLANKAAAENDSEKRAAHTEAFKEAQAQLTEAKSKLESCPAYAVSDVTKEALAMKMASQPHQAIASISSEARGIFSIVKGRYGKEGGDEEFYCMAYSGDNVTFDRVSRVGVSLGRPCLTMLWMVQPDVIRDALDNEVLVSSGFLPRFLLVDSDAEPQLRESEPEPILYKIKGRWAKLVSSLIMSFRNNPGEPLVVPVDAGARKVLHQYEEEAKIVRRPGGEHQDIPAYVARWAENAWRLALVLHAMEHSASAVSEPLTQATAEAAVGIMRWFNHRQLQVLAADRFSNDRKRLLELLSVLADADGEVTVRALVRSHGFKREEIEKLCSVFPSRIVLEEKKGQTGRPSEVVRAV